MSETPQAFLAGLGEALRPLRDPVTIQAEATRLFGEHLGVDRVFYAEMDTDDLHLTIEREYAVPGVGSTVGRFLLDDFGPALIRRLRAAETVAVADLKRSPIIPEPERAAFLGIGILAFVAIPLVKEGRLVAILGVHHTSPRRWNSDEVALTEELAERTWAAVERARSEVNLRASEARYRALVEHVRDYGIYLLDASGHVTEWTPGAEHVKGYTAAEALGQHVSRFYLPEQVAAGDVERDLAEAATRGRSEREAWRTRKGGTRFWANEIMTAIPGDQGQVVGFTRVTRDLSEQRRLQDQRELLLEMAREAQSQAEEANRAKDEFLAVLSHELRTPLAPILLWSRALRSGQVPARDQGRAVEAIVHSAESQSRLIEDLLDLSRLKSNRLLLLPQGVRVERVARAAFEMLRPIAQAKQVALELDVAPDLDTAWLDEARLQQVLWNLLSNAVKFTPAGGRVCLSVRKTADHLEAQVADTGQGIPESFMPHLFQRFRQANMGESRSHSGLGIGLALCHQLVALHGGSIDAHSDGPGCGATFTVRIPWVHGGPPPSDDDAAPRSPEGTSRLLEDLKVLLVEDDPSTRDAMRWTLERQGARVHAVGSGTDALRVLGEGRTEVVVCDLGLPGMDGYELLARISEHCHAWGQDVLPTCAVSAHAREVDRRRAIEAGFELYLAKPLSAEALIEAVEELAVLAGRRD